MTLPATIACGFSSQAIMFSGRMRSAAAMWTTAVCHMGQRRAHETICAGDTRNDMARAAAVFAMSAAPFLGLPLVGSVTLV